MAGVKGRSGRKRDVKNALHYFNQIYDLNSYSLAEITIKKALEGDRELLIYCHDRRLGKPKQTTELQGDSMGAQFFVLALQAIQSRQARVLEITGGITDGQNSSGEDEAIP